MLFLFKNLVGDLFQFFLLFGNFMVESEQALITAEIMLTARGIMDRIPRKMSVLKIVNEKSRGKFKRDEFRGLDKV